MKRFEKILAQDVMTKEVLTIHQKASLSQFIDHLIDKHINGIPVVNDDDKLVGIATKNDLLVYELTRELHSLYSENIHDLFKDITKFDNIIKKDGATIFVEDIMVSEVITVDPDTSIQAVCTIMKNKKLNHIIVIDEGAIVGIITSRDIIHLLSETVD